METEKKETPPVEEKQIPTKNVDTPVPPTPSPVKSVIPPIEVSPPNSFPKPSPPISISMPPVVQHDTTEKAAVHKKVEKIVGMKIVNDKKYFLVKYAGQKEFVVVDGDIIRKHNQKVLLNFYEEHIKLIESSTITEEVFNQLVSKTK